MAKGYRAKHQVVRSANTSASHPAGGVEPWYTDSDGRVRVIRDAEFWHGVDGQTVECSLCYRRCRIEPGAAGWCKVRENRAGQLVLNSHGVLSECNLALHGYQTDPFICYKPGSRTLIVGQLACTAKCAFCFSMQKVWNSERVPWSPAGERRPFNRLFTGMRVMVHPTGVVSTAIEMGCTEISFAVNEPTLTIEYVLDTSTLAKRAGLGVSLLTNGFTSPAAIGRLAGLVDAVDLGAKSSLSENFYSRWMKAPGGPDAVRASLLAWKASGAYLMISDLVPPAHMQDDSAFEQSASEFYKWVRDELGDIVILILPMLNPRDYYSDSGGLGLLMPADSSLLDVQRYLERLDRVKETCRESGLHYAVTDRESPVCCHACGEFLLQMISPRVSCEPCVNGFSFCRRWSHKQNVTDSHCPWCGAEVPIVVLLPAELAESRAYIAGLPPFEQVVTPA